MNWRTTILDTLSRGFSVAFPRRRHMTLPSGQSELRVDRNPPHYIAAYYNHCTNLLRHALDTIESVTAVRIALHADASPRRWSGKTVLMQLEHTLVAPGGRDMHNAPKGNVPLVDGEGTYHVRLDAGETAVDQADAIIEYSCANIANVTDSDLAHLYAGKAFYVPPLLCRPNTMSEPRSTPHICTMHGQSTTGRRGELADILTARGIHVENIEGVWSQYEAALDRYAILLNVHQTENHHTLEELRVLPAILRQVVVVTEEVPLIRTLPYGDFLVTAPFRSLPDVLAQVRDNYEEYWHSIYGSGEAQDLYKQLRHESERTALEMALLLNQR